MTSGTRTNAPLSAIGREAFGRVTKRLLRAALLGALMLSQAAAADWGLPELMTALAQRGTHESRFIEEKRVDLLEHALILEGILRYEPPARLDKVVKSPRSERYAAHGDTLVITRGDEAPREIALTDHPALRAFIAALRDTLAGDLAALEAHHRLVLTGNAERWDLKLLPKHRPLSTHVLELRIRGSGGVMNTFEVHEASGDSSVMRIQP